MFRDQTQTTISLGSPFGNEITALGSNSLSSSMALTSSDLGILEQERRLHKVIGAGHDIFQQGGTCKNVYVLLEGWAFCYRVLEDGHRQILDLALPGSVLGFHFAKTLPYGVEAKTSCKVAVFSREAFVASLLKSPHLCLKCAELFASAEARAFDRLSRVGRLSAQERVAGLIVELATRLRAYDNGNEAQIQLPLTQQDMADMLGLANETVCRALMALRKQSLVTWQGGKIEIFDLEALVEAAGEDIEAFGYEFDRESLRCITHSNSRADS
jgi:CRP/FNR family transcriptional regulator, anaerobic regulatory protein